MVVIGVVAGIIVAAGTIITGAISAAKWFYMRGQKKRDEDYYRAKLAADIEELKNSHKNQSDGGSRL